MNFPAIHISTEWDAIPTLCPPPPPPSSPRSTWEDALPNILRTVQKWEATMPETPSPPIMGDLDRVTRLWELTQRWPHDMVEMAERMGYTLPGPEHPVVVQNVLDGLFQRRMERLHNGNDWYNPDLEEQWKMMTDEDRIRHHPESVSIVLPEVQEMLGGGHMIREPNQGWWGDGERRNRYVTAGYGVLFRRDEMEVEVLLHPMPPLPEDAKNWNWKEQLEWQKEQRSKIPKIMVSVVYEYGSRRHAEGTPVLDHEGKVVRLRVAGEWTRERIAMLKGTPSPYFFDDFTGHPMPHHSTKARAFRQEVADAAFVYQHQ